MFKAKPPPLRVVVSTFVKLVILTKIHWNEKRKTKRQNARVTEEHCVHFLLIHWDIFLSSSDTGTPHEGCCKHTCLACKVSDLSPLFKQCQTLHVQGLVKMKIICFSPLYIIVSFISFGFKLLFRQRKLYGDVTLNCRKYFSLFSDIL